MSLIGRKHPRSISKSEFGWHKEDFRGVDWFSLSHQTFISLTKQEKHCQSAASQWLC